MSNAKKGIALLVVVLLGGLLWLYFGYLYKDARNVSSEDAAFAVRAEQLAADYTGNAATADAKYLNKTIEVQGVITEVSDSVVTINKNIFCAFDKLPAGAMPNAKVTIKGRCIGYDELFSEVKLDQCSIQQ
jgi:hypothetical protein